MHDIYRNRIKSLSDIEIKENIRLKEKDFQPGVYQLFLDEALERKIDIDHEKAEQLKQESLRIAPIGKRMINFIVDIIVLIGVPRLVLMNSVRNGLISPVYVSLLIFLFYFSYYVILERKFGKTLGKLLTKTSVVTDLGEIPTANQIIARTFGRLIPFNTWITLFSGFSLHDRVSKTRCISDIKRGT